MLGCGCSRTGLSVRWSVSRPTPLELFEVMAERVSLFAAGPLVVGEDGGAVHAHDGAPATVMAQDRSLAVFPASFIGVQRKGHQVPIVRGRETAHPADFSLEGGKIPLAVVALVQHQHQRLDMGKPGPADRPPSGRRRPVASSRNLLERDSLPHASRFIVTQLAGCT
jgi:hypothetical protein